MSQDPNKEKKHNESQPQSYNLQDTLARIDAMEAQFKSTKAEFQKGIEKLQKVIVKAASQYPHDYNQCNQSYSAQRNQNYGYARADADCKEFFDDEKTLDTKIKKLAQLIKQSKHFVAFTGAGISTAAGIPDYRSGINTSLDTGTGIWAKKTAIKQGKIKQIKQPKIKNKGLCKTIPTTSHMALVALMNQKPNYLKYLVSQNVDGLHRVSGIPPNQLSELHGNTCLKVCKKCKKEYLKDYNCRNLTCHCHQTGHHCFVKDCGGKLKGTVVAFGQELPELALKLGDEHHEKADLCLVLGSSLYVTPAKDMPENVGAKWQIEKIKYPNKEAIHNLCIVNLQKTDSDSLCSVRIFAKIDVVMCGLMKELNMDIPKWKLQRYVKITFDNNCNDNEFKRLIVCGVDIDGIDAAIFSTVRLKNDGKKIVM
eukprot:52700_1